MKRVKALPGFVVIEPKEINSSEINGIIIPGANDKRGSSVGIVIHCGAPIFLAPAKDEIIGRDTTLPCPVEVGDVVVYRKYSEQDVKVDGDTFQLVKFQELMGVVVGLGK